MGRVLPVSTLLVIDSAVSIYWWFRSSAGGVVEDYCDAFGSLKQTFRSCLCRCFFFVRKCCDFWKRKFRNGSQGQPNSGKGVGRTDDNPRFVLDGPQCIEYLLIRNCAHITLFSCSTHV